MTVRSDCIASAAGFVLKRMTMETSRSGMFVYKKSEPVSGFALVIRSAFEIGDPCVQIFNSFEIPGIERIPEIHIKKLLMLRKIPLRELVKEHPCETQLGDKIVGIRQSF